MGGYIIRCTWCHTDISLYLPISWLFWMGSHWLHWKVKSSLWALAVSNGGYIVRFTWCHTDISLYLPISWLFRIGSHWLHWKVKSSLWALAVLNGGGRTSPVSFSSNNCFEWVLIDGMDMHRVRSFSLAVSFGGEDITCHFLVKWLFQMGSHWQYGNT